MAGYPIIQKQEDKKYLNDIVGSYNILDAPTGEGTVYITRDGNHWQKAPFWYGKNTGDDPHYIKNGRMVTR